MFFIVDTLKCHRPIYDELNLEWIYDAYWDFLFFGVELGLKILLSFTHPRS